MLISCLLNLFLLWSELEFPSSLASTERAYIHRLCQGLGLKSKSKGYVLVIIKGMYRI